MNAQCIALNRYNFPATMSYAHRKTVHLENDRIRLTVLPGGGHIAAVTLKSNGVNPLWDPLWETIEPTSYDPARHAEYGPPIEGGLLAGIVGHNLCFDFFGPPSEEEFAAGLYVHGEASFVDWEVSVAGGELIARAELPLAQMRFERRISLSPGSQVAVVRETAENLTAFDRPVGWTQHVTLGPPFLEKGKTICNMPATASKVIESDFAPGRNRLKLGAEFTWPTAPRNAGGWSDLRVMPDDDASGTYTAHLMNPAFEQSWFTAYQPSSKTAFGYVWRRSDFPWLGIWEENHSREHPPWRGRSLTRGMEFGASPFPEVRRAMVERGEMFGERGFRWIAAKAKAEVEYALFIAEASEPPAVVERSGGRVTAPGLGDLPE